MCSFKDNELTTPCFSAYPADPSIRDHPVISCRNGNPRAPSALGLAVRPSAEDIDHMRLALAEARAARDAGEVPVGAVVVHDGRVVGRGANRTVSDQDATTHAEMVAIREASAALGSWRLADCTLYVTLEPCAMCAGAMVLARLDRVVFGAWDDAAGMAGSVVDLLRHPSLNHRPQVLGGVLAEECAEVLRDFFRARR